EVAPLAALPCLFERRQDALEAPLEAHLALVLLARPRGLRDVALLARAPEDLRARFLRELVPGRVEVEAVHPADALEEGEVDVREEQRAAARARDEQGAR